MTPDEVRLSSYFFTANYQILYRLSNIFLVVSPEFSVQETCFLSEHLLAFIDVLLISPSFMQDKNTSESRQQAVIPANKSRYCVEISLTKLTLYHCF